MFKFCIILTLVVIAYLKFAHLASLLPGQPDRSPAHMAYHSMSGQDQRLNKPTTIIESDEPELALTSTTAAAEMTTTITETSQEATPGNQETSASSDIATSTATQSATTAPTTTTTIDPNIDPEELPLPTSGGDLLSNLTTQAPTVGFPNKIDSTNSSKMPPNSGSSDRKSISANLELSVLFYSLFIVYVSFVKLIYHNIGVINRNITEPGILMIFGIIWELIIRQLSSNHEVFPRFNSRIFFYLFLPSTVLESASLLANKWLYFNLLPILIHSIVGTIIYASSIGFTIYSLGQYNIFNLSLANSMESSLTTAGSLFEGVGPVNISKIPSKLYSQDIVEQQDLSYVIEGSSTMQFNNLTLADCLIFGTVLASIDSTSMLGVFKLYQVNDKLYYLVLGENLMNNATVLVLFDLLLDFFHATRLTVVKIYIAILQFFATLFGSVFIGLLLAAVALISIRLTKRFQVPNVLSSYQNQCQAMVETLLILKLAYLTYTLASLAGTSSIVSLATFGILKDQYIKQNLNLRSQITYKQVILATKTMGFSLVYPLLGMLLVEVANTAAWTPYEHSSPQQPATSASNGNRQRAILANMSSASSVAISRLSHFADQANVYWNFKFLSVLTILTIAYRFIIVIAMSTISNLLTNERLKIRFKEQVLMASGGLKGPLAIALVQKLIEHQQHDDYRDRMARNRHLFTYTILFITFISTVLVGSFMRPLVAKIQSTLVGLLPGNAGDSSGGDGVGGGRQVAMLAENTSPTVVFDEINYKLTEYISHGLNSILGRTKSPYERFVEFNESHIKPWLTRTKTNTNWLDIFYTDLVLDETLNANCFHIATEDPTTMRMFRNQQLHNRRRKSSLLNTIDEHSMVLNERHRRPSRYFSHKIRPSAVALVPNHYRLPHYIEQSKVQVKTPGGIPEKTLMREFVMLNLSLEDTKSQDARRLNRPTFSQHHNRRRQKKDYMSRISTHTDGADSETKHLSTTSRHGDGRMLSTTSEDGDDECGHLIEKRAKERYLKQLEHRWDKETINLALGDHSWPSTRGGREVVDLSDLHRGKQLRGPATLKLNESAIAAQQLTPSQIRHAHHRPRDPKRGGPPDKSNTHAED